MSFVSVCSSDKEFRMSRFAVAALALSLSACQKKADEAAAPAADSAATAPAATPPAADASATAAAPATPPAPVPDAATAPPTTETGVER